MVVVSLGASSQTPALPREPQNTTLRLPTWLCHRHPMVPQQTQNPVSRLCGRERRPGKDFRGRAQKWCAGCRGPHPPLAGEHHPASQRGEQQNPHGCRGAARGPLPPRPCPAQSKQRLGSSGASWVMSAGSRCQLLLPATQAG